MYESQLNLYKWFAQQVSLFAELFNEMLQRDFGYRIYKALAAIPAKDEKKDKEKKAKKETEKRDIKKEKDEDIEEPLVKKSKEDEDDKRKASLSNPQSFFQAVIIQQLKCVHAAVWRMFLNSDDKKAIKKESSRDEEDNEDEGSMANAEEYDPMEAEDADDDDDDGTALFFL